MPNKREQAQEFAAELDEQSAIRLNKLKDLRAKGQDPYEVTKCEQSHHSLEIIDQFDQLEGQTVKVAGRIMSKRGMGKVSFVDLYDRQGKIQLFTKLDVLGDEAYKAWQNLDIGDLIQVTGEVFKTQRGEISIKTADFLLLSKGLKPLPEKFHGLQDTDTRYRKRYLDLIVNPEVKDSFEKRSKIIASLRQGMESRNFLEVETPILNVIAGGAAARPFITHHNTLDIDLYLRIAPELYLKRLIVGGFERVFEIGRNFRNEGMSYKHNPEFTMLELYQAFADYHDMMELAESLIAQACLAVNGQTKTVFQGKEIDLTPPFCRLTMQEAVKEYAGVDFDLTMPKEEAHKLAAEHGIEVEADFDTGKVLNAFFEERVEDKLIQPTFVYDYPLSISPLSKQKKGKPYLTERFEIFINGAEYGNAYSELNDPYEQDRRFQEQISQREAGDQEAQMGDSDYVEALEYGMPPTGGLGIGIDRLVMLLTDNSSIRDVLLFPTMKPIGQQVKTAKAPAQESNQILSDIDFSKVKVEPLFEDMIDFEEFQRADYRVVKVLDCEEVPKSKKLLKFTLDDGSGKTRVILSGIKDYYSAEELVGKTLLAICNLPARKMMGIDSEGMLISAIHEEEGEERLNLIILDNRIPAGAKLY